LSFCRSFVGQLTRLPIACFLVAGWHFVWLAVLIWAVARLHWLQAWTDANSLFELDRGTGLVTVHTITPFTPDDSLLANVDTA